MMPFAMVLSKVLFIRKSILRTFSYLEQNDLPNIVFLFKYHCYIVCMYCKIS